MNEKKNNFVRDRNKCYLHYARLIIQYYKMLIVIRVQDVIILA